jgi:hypothetical protein
VGRKAGFVKKHVNELAATTRGELGLEPFDRLNPLALAEHLAIPVHPLSELRAANPDAADHLLHREPESFSAVTVFRGPLRFIVHNDSHAPSRQNSNICHELSHGLLLHEPAPAVDASGCRDWDQVMEDEAQWLAGALLVPEVVVVVGVKRGRSEQELAHAYGVSVEMIRWRINLTGARRRAARARNSR